MRPAWDDLSDDEAVEEKQAEYGGSAATIFLIEASKPMFDPDINDESYFRKCIECCKTYLLQQIRDSKKGPTAIVLFGTKQGTDSWSNVSVLQDLSQPSADRVKELMKILESENYADFDKKFGHSSDFSVANALWFCHQLLSACKQKLSMKNIIMMTCTPDPHVNDLDKQRQAKLRASSLNDASVMLNVIPLGTSFDKKAFYSDLVQIVNGKDDDDFIGIEEPSESIDEIIRKINQCGSQKRSTGRILWHLGNDVKLAVAVYNLVQPVTVPTKKRLFRQTNDEVQAKQQMFSAETGEVLCTVKELKVVEYAEKKISFDAEEWRQAKQISENGIVLLGFKPKSCVEYFVQKSAFIYPEENLVKGSRTLFAALHQRCVDRDVVPICLFKPRKVSPPKLVALWPQEETRNARGVQIAAAGFVVVYLPYANYVRDLSAFSSKTIPNQELVDVSKQIVRKLKADFDPYAIRNPKIQTHWANIEAIALGLEDTEKVPDETVPDNEKIKDALGDLSRDFIEMGLGSDFDASEIHAKVKRAQSSAAEKPAKKPKIEINPERMRDIAEAGQVNSLKVEDLKRYLQGEGIRLKATYKKVDLVKLVYDHLEMDA